MDQNRIVELATLISHNVAKIDSYQNSNGFGSLSFNIDSPFADTSFPKEINSVRNAVLEANLELSELLLGPKETVAEYQYNYHVWHYDHGPWKSLPAGGTIVDVGGSHGQEMVAIAEKFQSLRFIVQDLPPTIAAHRPIPTEFNDRISFMEHDFFAPQPITNADVYLFRWIFHNWPDKHCLRILKNLVPALKPGTKVVVNEICLPEPNTIPVRKERKLRAMDVAMMTMQNAQERDKDDWIDLFRRADERFRFEHVIQPKHSDLAIIEFTWSDSN